MKKIVKRTILVLDAHTNGYEAAVRLIRKQGWKVAECNIVFCRSHNAILQKLSEGPAFAVVPVQNSTKGEIASVTSELAKYRAAGFLFDVVDTFVLKINHYLMVPPHITSVDQLERVMSKDEAMGQCDKYLRSINITAEKRSGRDSTGGAARVVSMMKFPSKIGAIAPKSAARAYRLKILASKIQDNKKNCTTFHLLQNKMEVKSVTVGIIGINGRFGKLLSQFFQSLGCKVIGSDRKFPTLFTNIQVAQQSNVIIFAIPIKRTVDAVAEILPYTRPGQFLTDVTSVKGPVINAMLKSKAQVVGLHPMFHPELGFAGQTIVVCPGRLDMPDWKTWLVNMLASTGSKLKWSTGKEHDIYMVTVQVSPQSANLVNALLVMEMRVPVRASLDFTSPFYRMQFLLMGRLLSQNPGMYASILMQNPATLPMLRTRLRIEKDLIKLIERQDVKGFTRLFDKAKAYFGPEVLREANELFQRHSAITKAFENPNAVILEFDKGYSRPRLLAKVSGVFGSRGVNLTGFNSTSIDGRRIQFLINFEGSKDDDRVQKALTQIRKWVRPRIEVIG